MKKGDGRGRTLLGRWLVWAVSLLGVVGAAGLVGWLLVSLLVGEESFRASFERQLTARLGAGGVVLGRLDVRVLGGIGLSAAGLELRDRDGNVIPLEAAYYPVGSAYR